MGLLEFPKPTREEEQNTTEKIECPRCGSNNTKFCYYNNYNKSQPRHFCKSCKRHWTKGGTLRNVPIGGGRNKNKRIKITPKEQTQKKTLIPDSVSMAEDSVFPRYHHQDLKFPFQFSDSCSFDADPCLIQPSSTVTCGFFNGEIAEGTRMADCGAFTWNWDDIVSPDFDLSFPDLGIKPMI